MSSAQYDARVRRLETGKTRWQPVVYTHPEPSEAWVAEVWQLLLDYGPFASEEVRLEALGEYVTLCWG